MLLRQIFDPYLAQYAYLVGCPRTGEALIIDPERDIDRYKKLAAENNLRIKAVAETHIHADFVSGTREFAQDPDVRFYLSAEGGTDWSYRWAKAHTGPGAHFLKHGDHFMVGKIKVEAVHTPGHTPEHLSYLITDIGGGADQPIALASGDFVFVGDVGRPDLLETAAGTKGAREPAARALQKSLHNRLTPFADYLQILPGHGAGSACGKSLGAVPTSTLGYERKYNAALKLALRDADAFVKDVLTGQPEPPLYFATMKRVNRDGIAVTGGAPKPPHLNAGDFSRHASDRAVRILDAREDREVFDTAHVARAIHAPLRSPLFSTASGSYLDANDNILLVLENADDADLAARQLYRIGFDRILGWISADEAKRARLFTAQVERIAFEDFDAADALHEGEIIDVRSTSEYESGHLDGARSFPYTRLKTRLDELPKDKRLFVHCATGKRASLAVSFLRAEGFDAVHVDGVCTECERLAEAN